MKLEKKEGKTRENRSIIQFLYIKKKVFKENRCKSKRREKSIDKGLKR